MIESPPSVQLRLAESRQWQGPVESGHEEVFNSGRVGNIPLTRAFERIGKGRQPRVCAAFYPFDPCSVNERRDVTSLVPNAVGDLGDLVNLRAPAPDEMNPDRSIAFLRRGIGLVVLFRTRVLCLDYRLIRILACPSHLLTSLTRSGRERGNEDYCDAKVGHY